MLLIFKVQWTNKLEQSKSQYESALCVLYESGERSYSLSVPEELERRASAVQSGLQESTAHVTRERVFGCRGRVVGRAALQWRVC